MENIFIVAVVAAIFFLFVFTMLIPIPLMIAARLSGVKVSPFTIAFMRLRGIDPFLIILPLIQTTQAELEDVDFDFLVDHHLQGGNVFKVVNAGIIASRANINVTFNDILKIDLSGRDVLEAVKMCVNPKVISTDFITAQAQDGIQVKVKCRVTVKANMAKIIGGSGEDTVIARVGEGIVTAIGRAASYADVFENPDHISELITQNNLEEGTAFEILSVDIADVDIGINKGAQLSINEAESDKERAQAKAEQNRSMAIARIQEMKALEQEMKAKLVESEAEIPKAISEALRTGALSIMDYYKIKNLLADTDMRTKISKL